MKVPFLIGVLFLFLGLQATFAWSDDEYAKIKSSAAGDFDTASAAGVLLNSAAKSADVAMFYHLQGNADLADQWLAVAWQDFQQAQALTAGKDAKPVTPAGS